MSKANRKVLILGFLFYFLSAIIKGEYNVKITKPDAVNEFNKFIDNISSKDKVAIFHDTDADGISAAAIITNSLEKENIKISKYFVQDHGENRTITDRFINILNQEGITKLICTDLALEAFKDAKKILIPVLVLDHHKTHNIIVPNNFVVYKPHLLQNEMDDSDVCSANLCFNLFKERVDISDNDWLASIGIIGDYNFHQEKAFLDSVFKKYDYEAKENIYDTIPGITVQHITFANTIGEFGAIAKARDSLLHSSSCEEATENLKEFRVVKDEIDRVVNNFNSKKEKVEDDFYIYIYESKYHVGSPVSSIISKDNVDKTIVTIQKKDDICKISARRQDKKKNMSILMYEATKNLDNANGGGHIPASGARIQRKDLDVFIKNIKRIHKTLKLLV